MTPKPAIIGLLAAFLFLASCNSKEKAVTPEEATATAHKIDSAINDKRPQVFDALLNEKLLARRIAKQADIKVTSSFTKGVATGLKNAGLGHQIVKAVSQDGSYELVKQYEKDGIQHLIFRMYSPEGLNYHDFQLARLNDKVYIADVYIYLVGDDFSSILTELVKSISGDEFGKVKKNSSALETMQTFKRLMNQERFEEAKKYYDNLPPDLKDQKLIRVMGIQVASKLDNESYLAELEAFEKLYPNEPNVHLMLIDANILRKEYDKAMENIQQLDKIISKDPFLDYYRALVVKMKGSPDEARTYLERLNKNMPGFSDGIIELMGNYLDAKEYHKALPLVQTYKSNEKFNQETLSAVLSMYPDFSVADEQ